MSFTPYYMVHEVFSQRDMSESFRTESRMSIYNFDLISWENKVKKKYASGLLNDDDR